MVLLIPLLLDLLVTFTAVPSPHQQTQTCMKQAEAISTHFAAELKDHQDDESDRFISGQMRGHRSIDSDGFGCTRLLCTRRSVAPWPLATGWMVPLRI
ncbi:hypothetical protein [Pontiella sp.]|uniref:hypothetical protein n=1 Tax=Pontiella sp. TaxID=2837462 RepID=UPI003565A71C